MSFVGALPRDTHFTGTLPQSQWEIELKPFLRSLAEIAWGLKKKKYLESRTCISFLSFFKSEFSGTQIHKFHKRSCHALNCSFYLRLGCLNCSVVRLLFTYQLKRLGRYLKSLLAFCTGRLFKLHFQVCVIPT